MAFTQRHLLGLEGIPADGDRGACSTRRRPSRRSRSATSRRCPTLRGKTVINLFYETSTRTRTSFEIAAKRLSADTINISASTSSTTQGRDARRHRAQPRSDAARRDRRPPPASGAPQLLAAPRRLSDHQRGRRLPRAPDAGAARPADHPRAARATSPACTVAIVGDMLHSRVGALEPPRAARARRDGAPGRSADAAAARVRVARRRAAHDASPTACATPTSS